MNVWPVPPVLQLTEHELLAEHVDGEADPERGGQAAQRHHQRVDVHLVVYHLRALRPALRTPHTITWDLSSHSKR